VAQADCLGNQLCADGACADKDVVNPAGHLIVPDAGASEPDAGSTPDVATTPDF
jgi:hypothetical protein